MVEYVKPVYHMFIDGHVEKVDSMDAKGKSSCVILEIVDFNVNDTSMVQSFLEMLMSETAGFMLEHDNAFDIDRGHMHNIHIDIGHMDVGTVANTLDLAHPYVMESSLEESIVVDMVRLCEITRVPSTLGSIMYDILVLIPEVAFDIGEFIVAVVKNVVVDIDIQHGGAMQVVMTYMKDMCGTFGSVQTYTRLDSLADRSLGLPHHKELDAHHHQHPMDTR